MPQYLTDLFGATEFLAALVGALLGGSATFLAEVYTARKAAKQDDEGWKRAKRTKALEDCYELLAELQMTVNRTDIREMHRILRAAELPRAQFHVRLYAPDATDVVNEIVGTCEAFADEIPPSDPFEEPPPLTANAEKIAGHIALLMKIFENTIRTPLPRPRSLGRG